MFRNFMSFRSLPTQPHPSTCLRSQEQINHHATEQLGGALSKEYENLKDEFVFIHKKLFYYLKGASISLSCQNKHNYYLFVH